MVYCIVGRSGLFTLVVETSYGATCERRYCLLTIGSLKDSLSRQKRR